MKSVIKHSLKVLTAKEKKPAAPANPPNVVEISKLPAFSSTAPQVIDALAAAGKTKGERTWDSTFLLGFNAGLFIALGGFFSLNAASNNTGFAANGYAGIQKLIFAMCFPTGLLLVIFAGAELFTGNVMTMTFALYKGKANILQLIKNWFWSYFGNLVGSVFFAYFFAYVVSPGQYDAATQEPWVLAIKSLAKTKCNYEWHVMLLKAIACNWIVSLAIFCATGAKDVAGKFIMFYFPIASFIVCGYEHSVANMFFLPLGFMYRGADITWLGIFYNLILVSLGNVIGALILFACVMLWSYEFREQFKNAEENVFLMLLWIFSGGKKGKIPFEIEIRKIEETELKPTPLPQTNNKKVDEETVIQTTKESNPVETKVNLS